MRGAIVVCVILIAAAGCGPPAHSTYGLSITNRTGRVVDNVEIAGGGIHFTFGVLIPGATKTFADAPHPIPENARLSWTDNDGRHRYVTLSLSPAVPRELRGEVVISMVEGGGTSVTVRADAPGVVVSNPPQTR